MPISRKHVSRVVAGLILLMLAAYGASVFYQTRPRQIVASLLRIDQAPSSLTNVECESWGMTDVLTTCAFDVDPADFPMLLAGWQFSEQLASGGSHSFANGPRLRPEFAVTTEFAVNPTEFKHGGRVSLVTNARRSRAQVDYYEE